MRPWPVVALATFACAPDPLAGLTVVGSDPPDRPLEGLDATWQARFDAGDVLFETPFTEAMGLGPAYVRSACAACHADDARGPGVVDKIALVAPDGRTPAPDPEAWPYGPTVRPHVAGGASEPVDVPDLSGVLVTTRAPNAVFGRGWMEAVREDEVLAVAEAQAARGDAITGRPNWVTWQSAAPPDPDLHPAPADGELLLGRFGLKARIATLDDFAADALQGDMSITSPLRPDELPTPEGRDDDLRPGVDVDLDTVWRLGDYVRLLAIPPRAATEGAEVFSRVGCDVCHVPTLRTRADHPVPQLADRDAPVFTDLLLHDMGPAFADGLTDGDAETSEWRTAPLMGLRHLRSYLHDGRADTVEEAIVLHGDEGSEAHDVVAAFQSLDDDARRRLVTYVESL